MTAVVYVVPASFESYFVYWYVRVLLWTTLGYHGILRSILILVDMIQPAYVLRSISYLSCGVPGTWYSLSVRINSVPGIHERIIACREDALHAGPSDTLFEFACVLRCTGGIDYG